MQKFTELAHSVESVTLKMNEEIIDPFFRRFFGDDTETNLTTGMMEASRRKKGIYSEKGSWSGVEKIKYRYYGMNSKKTLDLYTYGWWLPGQCTNPGTHKFPLLASFHKIMNGNCQNVHVNFCPILLNGLDFKCDFHGEKMLTKERHAIPNHGFLLHITNTNHFNKIFYDYVFDLVHICHEMSLESSCHIKYRYDN